MKSHRLKSLVKTSEKHGFDLKNFQFHYQLPIFFKETARGLPLPPLATTSATLACGSIPSFPLTTQVYCYAGPIPLPPFCHESGPMLAGPYLFPPLHDIRHLPAGDSKSRVLLCKESTSRMIFEEIYMTFTFISLTNHIFNLNFSHFAYRNDSMFLIPKPRGQILFLK